MALSTSSNKVIHAGNGVATSFAYTFPILEASHLVVIYTNTAGVETTLDPTLYSVTGIGGTSGGAVTYPLSGSPIATGTLLTIMRTVPLTQTTVLSNQGGYYPEVVEARFDRVYMGLQQLEERLGRAYLTAPSGVAPSNASVYTVQNIAELTALVARPSSVVVGGKLTALDGGGSVFYWVLGDTTTADGINTVSPSSGPAGRYKRLERGAVNVKSYGTDTTAFQAAIDSVASGSHIEIFVPPGAYTLATNVSANGRIVSWKIDAGATFSGAGTLPSVNVTLYGDVGYKNAGTVLVRGSSGTPNTELSPLALYKKISSAAPDGSKPNTVHAVQGERRTTTTSGARLTGYWSEIEDYAGGTGTFSEGGRFGSSLMGGSDGAAYGVIALAGIDSGVTSFDYAVAVEGVVSNNKTDAPVIASFSTGQYTACYIATTHFGTKMVDAGFLLNPFNNTGGGVAMPRTGFLAPENSIDPNGQILGSRATVAYGLNFINGTHSQAIILTKNNETLWRARNNANNANHNLAYYSTADKLVLGTDAAGITMIPPLLLPAGTTAGASLNVPHGAAPTSPVNGDIWTTTAGLFARINGATVGPYIS